jgi:predicted unusual protein kinase regulating ubiquinone biosynthesis (AarF/ABC1/UbiB family)
MVNFIRKISFQITVFFIIAIEFIKFCWHKDYLHLIRSITYKLSKENILYVKLFQAIAMNKNWISDDLNNELLRFTDTVPYNEYDIDNNLIKNIMEEYNLKYENNFHLFKPIKAGMISLVFKMYKKVDDVPIILKIKRKNIDDKLDVAIENLQFFVYILSFLPYFQTLSIATIFNKNVVSLKQQLCFKKEVENMLDATHNCRNLKYIVIPHVYSEVTENYSNVIMMDFITGKTIMEIDEEDYSEYSALLLKYGMVSLLLHGITHGDLHAGNILFLKDDTNNSSEHKHKLALLDFGVVMKLENYEREKSLSLAVDLYEVPVRKLGQELLMMALEPKFVLTNLPNNHFEKMLDIVEKILTNALYSKNEANQTKIYQGIMEINTYLNNGNLRALNLNVSDLFVKVQMTLAMCNGINMALCKNDYMTVANKTLNELFHLDLLKYD